MFERLQKKWKVGRLQLTMVLFTFAIGGSLTGFVGKKIMNALGIQQDWLWVVIYILIVTLLWPIAVMLVSIPFGQFPFFRKYLKKMGERIGIVRKSGPDLFTVKNIAIFASGTGSNAAKIIDHFRDHDKIKVTLIVCNNPSAKVLDIANENGIPTLLITKDRFFTGDGYLPELREIKVGFLVLAGFLWKIPKTLLEAYPGHIINIHPALLPKYGGKGMYGLRVHESVISHKEKESGITIHYVDEKYDNGDIIFQATCPVMEDDTAASLAKRVGGLEHRHFAEVIEKILGD